MPTEAEYQKRSEEISPKSPMLKDCTLAFLSGGFLCALGQAVSLWAGQVGFSRETGSLLASLSIMALSVILTAYGVYDGIAKHAGAGTLVPISGFANAVAAPAIEFKSEGFVLGVGAKMFQIAGPVIVYGVSASVVYGLIYWITTLF